MKKNIFFCIVVVLLIGLSFFFLLREQNSTPAQKKTYETGISIDEIPLPAGTGGYIFPGDCFIAIDETTLNNIYTINYYSDFELVLNIYDDQNVSETDAVRQYTYEHSVSEETTNVKYSICPLAVDSNKYPYLSDGIYYAQMSVVLNGVEYVSQVEEFRSYNNNGYKYIFNFLLVEKNKA